MCTKKYNENWKAKTVHIVEELTKPNKYDAFT